MTQRSFFWNTLGGGDGQVYTQAELMDRFFRAILNGTGSQGVLFNWLDNLEVTGSSSPLNVATGAAVIYGMYFESDTAVSVTIPIPDSGTRTDLIVVRRAWSGQTCRIARKAGPGAVLEQTANDVWEIPLASVEVTSAGVITITDTRDYCTFGTSWPPGTVGTDQFADGAVAPVSIADRTRWDLRGAGDLWPESGAMYGAEWDPGGGLYGVPYEYWRMQDGITDALWAFFMAPVGLVGGEVDFYVWNIPDTNGLGAGAENVRWDYMAYYCTYDVSFTAFETGTILVDQQARSAGTVYADQVVNNLAVEVGWLIAIRIDRAGAQPNDTYLSPVQLLGIEQRWLADS